MILMPAYEPNDKHARWITLIKYLGSFSVGVVVAIFLLGGARQRVVTLGNDMDAWKEEWRTVHNPRIERMDSKGTTSFDLFHQEYLRTQHRQEETMKDLDRRVRELERKP